ncbi:hypothetical protein [Streptomyces kanamyceticus]|uniref:hypothetical protein n=1 Tax=Streptomyces kanamyceticus TaxID=1967 RepID=UPI0037DD2FB2
MSAILTSKVAADVITSLLEHARAAAAAIRAWVAAVVDVALAAAVDVTATVFVMNDGGRFHRRHLLAEARRHFALVLRGRRRDPGLDDQVVAAAISTHCLDIGEPKTVRGLEAGYRLYTARWSLSDLPTRRPPTPAPDPDRQPPADPGEPAAPRSPGQDAGEWEIPRIPLPYERAVLAGAVVREKLRTTATAVRGRAYDVVAHQQAAMPEQLLAPEPADPEHHDQEPDAGPGEAIDMKALRTLRESRTDVEALDLTADRLRRLQDVFTEAGEDSRARATRYPHRTTPTQCARCAGTTSRRTDHSNLDRTGAGRPATERTSMARTGAVVRPVDVRFPLHRVESTGRRLAVGHRGTRWASAGPWRETSARRRRNCRPVADCGHLWRCRHWLLSRVQRQVRPLLVGPGRSCQWWRSSMTGMMRLVRGWRRS